MISPQQQRAVYNNQYAQAAMSGDPRYQAKQYDRAGVSRGAGTNNQASIQGGQKFAEGVAEAYRNKAQMQQYNQGIGMQMQQSDMQQAQAIAGLLQQQAYQNQMAQQQRSNMGMNFATGILGGLLS
jgi:hypothetical protein